jgi:DNA-binding CsgD family transcriptional regulator
VSARTTRVQLDGVEYLVVEWAPAQPTGLSSLTPSERAVAKLVADGATNATIAKLRKTSARTVANQIGAILKKLGVPSRVHVAAMLKGRSE